MRARNTRQSAVAATRINNSHDDSRSTGADAGAPQRPQHVDLADLRQKIGRSDKQLVQAMATVLAEDCPSLLVALDLSLHVSPPPPPSLDRQLQSRSQTGDSLPRSLSGSTTSRSDGGSADVPASPRPAMRHRWKPPGISERIREPSQREGPLQSGRSFSPTLDSLLDSREELLSAESDGSMDVARRSTRLDAVCAEIVATEERYAEDLRLLCVHVFEPLVAARLLPALCASGESLRALHAPLAERMGRAMAACRGGALAAGLGSALVEASASFDAYVDYCAGFAASLRALEHARLARPSVQCCLARAQAAAAECVGRREGRALVASPQLLFALLIKPVQRLCQYPLLLREALSCMHACTPAGADERAPAVRGLGTCGPVSVGHTACEHPRSRGEVEASLQVIEERVARVNEAVRDRERDAQLERGPSSRQLGHPCPRGDAPRSPPRPAPTFEPEPTPPALPLGVKRRRGSLDASADQPAPRGAGWARARRSSLAAVVALGLVSARRDGGRAGVSPPGCIIIP